MRKLFRRRFPEFQAAYEKRYATTFGRFRLPLIVRAASAFRVCGDWNQGIARIAATVLRGIQVPQVRKGNGLQIGGVDLGVNRSGIDAGVPEHVSDLLDGNSLVDHSGCQTVAPMPSSV